MSNKSQQEINNLEIQIDKKYDELKAEKDELLEEMTKMPGEKDIERDEMNSVERKKKIETNLKLF